MKKLSLLFALIAVCVSISAQDVKVGYINAQEVLYMMPEISKIESDMADFNSKNMEYLQTMQKEIQDKAAKFEQEKDTMSPAIRKAEEESLNMLYERFQTTYQQLQQESQNKQNELMQPVVEKLRAAITTVAERLKLTVVHDATAVLYVGDKAIDITSQVKKELGIF